MFSRVHVTGGLHVMGCECLVECTCIWWPGLHVMGCECSVEYMYLVAWLTCHGM